MRIDTLELLRCPYCGGRLSLVESMHHERTAEEIHVGVLGCHCCIFPIVDGIPVLHLQPAATAAREQIEAKRPELARRAMFGIAEAARAEAFDAVVGSEASTYREIVEALGPSFEGGYFVFRFSDPTYIVARALTRAVGSTVLGPSAGSGSPRAPSREGGARRAIDVCGGSGHVTRALLDLSSAPPVLADLYFSKIWLARRFTAPGCEPVCCDGNAPFPFARGAFRFAMCTDAFMFIWTKRQFVTEMERLVASDDPHPGAVLIGHAHNERVWSPSHGQPLSPEAYVDLFETLGPRVFGEAGLFSDVVKGGPLDLSRRDSKATLDRDPALALIATRDARVFAPHALDLEDRAVGEFRLNPMYAMEPEGSRVRLELRFPSEDYEQEYGACREYLPQEAIVDRAVLDALPAARASGPLAELARRRIILDLPRRYY
jgi:uncharacterized protein YbaR (Trm112 family)